MRGVRVAVLATLACLVMATPALAAKPVMEKVVINEVGIHDEFLSEACGFDVFIDVTGHIIFRTFLDADGAPVREVNNFGVHLHMYSEWGSLKLVDVGVDRVLFNEDGSITVFVVGNVTSIQLPGEGRVYSDVGLTELLFTFPDPEGPPVVDIIRQAGQHSEGGQVEAVCEALAP